MDNLYDEQERLEHEMLEIGRQEYFQKVLKSKEAGRETETSYGQTALRHVYQPVYEALVEWRANAKSGKYGWNYAAEKLLTRLGLSDDLVAYMVCRILLDHLSHPRSFQSSAISLAGCLEDEARSIAFAEKFPDVMERISDKLKNSSTYERRRRIMAHMVHRFNLEWTRMLDKEKLSLGVALIELFRKSTGLIVVSSHKGTRAVTKIGPSKQCSDWMAEFIDRSALIAPLRWPMVVEPLPWTGMWTGGYLTLDPVKTPIPFIKTRSKWAKKRLEDTPMPEVWKAVNLIQNTPFKVNTRLLEVLKHFWTNSWDLAGLPSREDRPLPPRPDDISENPVSRKEWSRKASDVHAWNETTRSKRIQVSKAIWIAEKFSIYENLYFPHQADFRGRLYCVPTFLNPQGPDYVRALLLFSRGKPLGNEDGPGWLAVHMANCFGVDKVSFDDRIKWVEDNQENILNSAKDPFSFRWWCEADDPWLFLASCFEWEGFVRDGPDYVCHLPVTMDGSCNGLQHFSAILRDEVGGGSVNLIPQDKPADVYGNVAKVVTEKLGQIADDPMAKAWLEIGIGRGDVKRPVMTLPYGVTQHSVMKYLDAALVEKLDKLKSPLFTNEEGKRQTWKASTFLTPIVWKSIGEVVVAARAAMDWLQTVGYQVSKAGYGLEWVTPDGFPVIQTYCRNNVLRIKTKLVDRHSIFLNYLEETHELDARRQSSGIAPNFVHSMDATHLRWYVLTAIENGINNFMCIHDSYGALPTDVGMMGKCLREAFIDLYEQNNVLEQFREHMLGSIPEEYHKLIPPTPPMGKLDLQQVRNSDYFFA